MMHKDPVFAPLQACLGSARMPRRGPLVRQLSHVYLDPMVADVAIVLSSGLVLGAQVLMYMQHNLLSGGIHVRWHP